MPAIKRKRGKDLAEKDALVIEANTASGIRTKLREQGALAQEFTRAAAKPDDKYRGKRIPSTTRREPWACSTRSAASRAGTARSSRSRDSYPVGDTELQQVLADIMSLTKVNVNTCIFGDGFPVPLRFADDVGEILTAIPEVTSKPLPSALHLSAMVLRG